MARVVGSSEAGRKIGEQVIGSLMAVWATFTLLSNYNLAPEERKDRRPSVQDPKLKAPIQIARNVSHE